MKKAIKLLSLLQLTKEQPLTGYVIAGIKLHELPSLAEHHYTAALAGYILCEKILKADGLIDKHKVLLMLLFHDLSELFGGDISGPLNRKYPDLRKHKNLIGERAIELLSEYLDIETRDYFISLFSEMDEAKTDEVIVVKIIDQMDHQFYLEHNNFRGKYNPGTQDYRPIFFREHIERLTLSIKDTNTRKVMNDFLETFKKSFYGQGFQSMNILFEEDKN